MLEGPLWLRDPRLCREPPALSLLACAPHGRDIPFLQPACWVPIPLAGHLLLAGSIALWALASPTSGDKDSTNHIDLLRGSNRTVPGTVSAANSYLNTIEIIIPTLPATSKSDFILQMKRLPSDGTED